MEVYFKRFDEAEKLYIEMDRKYVGGRVLVGGDIHSLQRPGRGPQAQTGRLVPSGAVTQDWWRGR